MATTSKEVREHLIRALEADLIGPFQAGVNELLPLPPSRWYLTGFLVPEGTAERDDPTDEEELGAGSDETEEETAGQEPEVKQRNRQPASLGLSVLLPQAEARESIQVKVSYADYVLEVDEKEEGKKRTRRGWRRTPRQPAPLTLPLEPAALRRGVPVADSGGLRVVGEIKQADSTGLDAGTRALSVFLVNGREPAPKGTRPDDRFVFQVCMEVTHSGGLVARPNVRDQQANDWDDRIADLQFRERCEYAVGHGVSVEVPPQPAPVTTVRTAWLPRAEVRRVVTREEDSVTTSMETIAELPDGATAATALRPLVGAYAAWIKLQRELGLKGPRSEFRDTLMVDAERACDRISAGIDLLERDPQAWDAFKLMNRAMAAAARKRNPERYEGGGVPRWRLFQLAFVLLCLRGIVEETHEDRDVVELVFFPTGGGKTEAYLGVIGFTLLLRRLQGQHRPDRGLGVAVLLRYTLRLLTLDQLGRAATLVCALEQIRLERPADLGSVRFAVGLWVGRTATANTMADARKRILEYKSSASDNAPSPFPLTNCPWCRDRLGPSSLTLAPDREDPTEVIVGCTSFRCEFSAGKNREGLPVLFVDEPIYRELPAFIIATVDKFAMLPWRGETGMLFGRVSAREGRQFYGPLDKVPKTAERLPAGIRPPELIVQDELHLISGPLGTMTGLYETAVNVLSTRTDEEGRSVKPKILASTATVRRAREQVRALFGRRVTAVFPPPGVDDSETFFARVDYDSPGRLYLGVAAPGRAMKALLLRVYVSLLCSAAHEFDSEGKGDQPADGYMTLVGYFNSLRELGGMRRLVEDEVRTRCIQAEERRPLEPVGAHPWSKTRAVQAEPVELTSRESTYRIAQSRARLAGSHQDKSHVDVLLASNMISVGIDIDRLGLMVVAGQPKTTSEYIQASSRVGRELKWPGLVVTCFNVHKPRDRSHYERFACFHESFYRFVEATSLTPFSGPALDRGLAGTLVAMVRLLNPSLTPSEAVMAISDHRKGAEVAVNEVAARGGLQPTFNGAKADEFMAVLADRARNLLDSWESITKEARKAAAPRTYSRFDKNRQGKPVLHTITDEDQPDEGSDEAKFSAPTSMRDVEPTVHLWLDRRLKSKG